MPIKIATFNLENLFQRPAAMSEKHDSNGREAIEDHARANAIAENQQYSVADKAELIRLSMKYGWHLLNPPKSALVQLQKIRGQLFRKPRTPKNAPLTVVASGRAAWTGWFELRKEDVTWLATYNTGRVIAEHQPDILLLVEVESRPTFRHFNDQVLLARFQMSYPHYLVIDGNDGRGIDVGIASRFPIVQVRSHVDDQYKDVEGEAPDDTRQVFSRDCPEYEISLPDGRTLIILPNHFKSKRNSGPAAPGELDESTARRKVQATRALAIAQQALARSPLVLIGGDLNDTPDSVPIKALLNHGFVDVNDHPSYPTDRPGTYGTGLATNKLDYLIMSPALRGALTGAGIERRGSYHPNTWEPFDTVTGPTSEASDHHLVWAKFDL